MNHMKKPSALPPLFDEIARSWQTGWWQGIAIGTVIGAACAVLLLGK